MVDLGCFTGGDFRQCVFDGAPSENMVGIDIANFWEVGYDLYRDRDKSRARFVEADLMSIGSENAPTELEALKGKVSIIHICQVLHQWNWEGQVEACKRLVHLSKVGTLVVGFQIGDQEGREVAASRLSSHAQWRHGPDSLRKMWQQVGEATGTKWKVQAKVLGWSGIGLDEEDAKFMEPRDTPVEFVVERES